MLLLLVEDGIIDLVLHDPMDFSVVKFSHVSALLSPAGRRQTGQGRDNIVPYLFSQISQGGQFL